ncbi:MAG TPA: DNA gyrase subunit A [Chitinophagaceae bacterium]|nr:DNA gyrase subunit A [Chitinophagaceae bacterium]
MDTQDAAFSPGGKIIQINIEEEMKTAYIDYSMSVIVSRALPDVRDGLKPVHRRVLFGMNELGNNSHKPYKKSARVVGEVMGKYHPHGDKAIYDTIVRLVQPWTMRYPLIDGQGNFGSVDGDSPAAMRYTEIRLQRAAEAILEDIDKETVDFTLNFDDTLEEPTVLPARIPNLLVNGASGIAVGMATNILPHNLSEVVEGCIQYIDNRNITIEELIKFVKAPDFPTGGIIYGYEGVKQGFETGRGRVVVRGKVNVETKSTGRELIVIYELPYQVNKAALHEKIAQLVNEKQIEGISDVRDESDRDGMRLVIDLKKDVIANLVINQLYKYSELQTSFGINNVALVNGRPQLLNLRELITEFIHFRHEIIVRRTKFELREAEKKSHILEGYLVALDHLDEFISLIRNSRTPELARDEMIARFGLTEIQAKAVLELRLQRLTGMERDKIKEEYSSLVQLIAQLNNILSDEGLRYQIIKEELIEVKRKFGDERKTEIQYLANEMRIEDIIAEQDVVITISHLGYIKRTAAEDYRLQKRGGRGAIGGKTREEDYIEHLFVASTHHTMLFFTEQGRCFWLKVYEIPEGEKQSKGRAIQNLINLPGEDKIRAIIDIRDLENKDFVKSHYIILCTRNGTIKKTSLDDFSRPRQNGINAITVNEGDQLLEAKLTNGKCEIMMAVKSGRAIRFPEDTVRDTGRGAIGVRGIEVDNEHDEVVGLICVERGDRSKTIMVVSEKGFGKRTGIEDYRITNRGGKGVKTINVTERTGALIAILGVEEGSDLMITCKSGITIRMPVAGIREAGRATQGVRLIRMDDGDEIAAVARLEDRDEVDLKIDPPAIGN